MKGLNKILLEGRVEDAREYYSKLLVGMVICCKTEEDVNEVLDYFIAGTHQVITNI